jgi:hypothetical protein
LNCDEKTNLKLEVLDRYKWPVIMYKKLTNDGDEQKYNFLMIQARNINYFQSVNR